MRREEPRGTEENAYEYWRPTGESVDIDGLVANIVAQEPSLEGMSWRSEPESYTVDPMNAELRLYFEEPDMEKEYRLEIRFIEGDRTYYYGEAYLTAHIGPIPIDKIQQFVDEEFGFASTLCHHSRPDPFILRPDEESALSVYYKLPQRCDYEVELWFKVDGQEPYRYDCWNESDYEGRKISVDRWIENMENWFGLSPDDVSTTQLTLIGGQENKLKLCYPEPEGWHTRYKVEIWIDDESGEPPFLYREFERDGESGIRP